VCDNSVGHAFVEETESRFKAYAYLGMFEQGEKFHCKCTTCGVPINEVYHDFDHTLCEDCLQLEYPKQKDWKKACKENPDECYYTEYNDEAGDDMEFVVVFDDEKDDVMDKFQLVEIVESEEESAISVIKIVDIGSSVVPIEVRDWLQKHKPYTYMDTFDCNEHMYCDLTETEIAHTEPLPTYIEQFNEKMLQLLKNMMPHIGALLTLKN
jgi:hypothetical protein